MRYVRALMAGLLACGLASCSTSYPDSAVTQGASASAIKVVGAPAGAKLFIDGIDYGLVSELSKDQAVSVTPGRHRVELTTNLGSAIAKDVFVGRGAIVEVGE